MAGKNHVHKYRKVTIAKNEVFGCAHGDCSHYMPKHMEDFLVGKRSICWACDNVFYMDPESMQMEYPTCITCRFADVNSPVKVIVVEKH